MKYSDRTLSAIPCTARHGLFSAKPTETPLPALMRCLQVFLLLGEHRALLSNAALGAAVCGISSNLSTAQSPELWEGDEKEVMLRSGG